MVEPVESTPISRSAGQCRRSGPTMPGAVAAGADAAHQDVQVVELGGQFGGEGGVTGGVVGVVVLVGPVRAGQPASRSRSRSSRARLPAARARRVGPRVRGARRTSAATGAWTAPARCRRPARRDGPRAWPGEGEPDAERAGGGLHHRCAGPQFAALLGRPAAWTPRPAPSSRRRPGPSSLAQKPGCGHGQIGGDPGQRGAAEQGEQLAVGRRGRAAAAVVTRRLRSSAR